MSRFGAYALYALLGSVVLGGALLVAPTPGELGFYEEVDCDAWLEEPRERSEVRLTDCRLQLATLELPSADGRSHLSVDPALLPPAARRTRANAPSASVYPSNGARARYLERHADELEVTVDLEGSIRGMLSPDWYYQMESARRRPSTRALGLTFLLLGLPMLLLFWRTERRWQRGAIALRSGGSQPKRF